MLISPALVRQGRRAPSLRAQERPKRSGRSATTPGLSAHHGGRVDAARSPACLEARHEARVRRVRQCSPTRALLDVSSLPGRSPRAPSPHHELRVDGDASSLPRCSPRAPALTASRAPPVPPVCPAWTHAPRAPSTHREPRVDAALVAPHRRKSARPVGARRRCPFRALARAEHSRPSPRSLVRGVRGFFARPLGPRRRESSSPSRGVRVPCCARTRAASVPVRAPVRAPALARRRSKSTPNRCAASTRIHPRVAPVPFCRPFGARRPCPFARPLGRGVRALSRALSCAASAQVPRPLACPVRAHSRARSRGVGANPRPTAARHRRELIRRQSRGIGANSPAHVASVPFCQALWARGVRALWRAPLAQVPRPLEYRVRARSRARSRAASVSVRASARVERRKQIHPHPQRGIGANSPADMRAAFVLFRLSFGARRPCPFACPLARGVRVRSPALWRAALTARVYPPSGARRWREFARPLADLEVCPPCKARAAPTAALARPPHGATPNVFRCCSRRFPVLLPAFPGVAPGVSRRFYRRFTGATAGIYRRFTGAMPGPTTGPTTGPPCHVDAGLVVRSTGLLARPCGATSARALWCALRAS